MSFFADKQTLDDLNLTGKYKPDSVFSLFNQVRTVGGEKLLAAWFQVPLTDPHQINQRSSTLRAFQRMGAEFPAPGKAVATMESWLEGGGSGLLGALTGAIRKKLSATLLRDDGYGQLAAGLAATAEVLMAFRRWLERLQPDSADPYRERLEQARRLLDDRRLNGLDTLRGGEEIPPVRVARYDHLLRCAMEEEIRTLLEILYEIDIYIAVSSVARTRGLNYARALPADSRRVHIKAVRHPCLEKAVANSVTLRSDSNMLFLTGANMAGKSTFMKTVGVTCYLAHMGFPVAVWEMEFSVMDGIYTSINVPDNLNLGYSHFYAEVLRVKKVAEEVAGGAKLYVVFDELFKGTNVKDAYDATLAVTEAFAFFQDCFFIISTHIVEVGESLKADCTNLQCAYFPTRMEGRTPVYPYLLEQGISSDRHGMRIIENEGIIDIILS